LRSRIARNVGAARTKEQRLRMRRVQWSFGLSFAKERTNDAIRGITAKGLGQHVEHAVDCKRFALAERLTKRPTRIARRANSMHDKKRARLSPHPFSELASPAGETGWRDVSAPRSHRAARRFSA
jgi:hypothetical protein